ncbi:hypothetical protein [Rhizobium sullae]|uniref:hypothetical protein n=1 Tax=Rhizobium sullae TaxID=50338 RepID=UPI0012ECA809|nr:hypothetical protein [Rhizobium sullae]
MMVSRCRGFTKPTHILCLGGARAILWKSNRAEPGNPADATPFGDCHRKWYQRKRQNKKLTRPSKVSIQKPIDTLFADSCFCCASRFATNFLLSKVENPLCVAQR